MIRSTTASSRALCLGVLLALGASAAPAVAQPSPADATLAESLFRDARKLMVEGRYAEACPKLQESQRLDPGGGTLLNLALCHAGEGKTATAWAELKEAQGAARRDGRSDREQVIQKSLAELEPRLSMVSVHVEDEARAAGVTVKLDGAPLGAAAWDTPFPVDPGPHNVEATAPGHQAFSNTFTLGPTHDRVTLTIPALAEAASAPGVLPPGRGSSRQKTAGYVVGSVGLAGLVVGGIFGVGAILQEKEARKTCSDTVCTDRAGFDASKQAAQSATASNLAFGLGAAGVAVGVILVLTAKKPADKPAVGQLVPAMGREGGGLVWQGRF